MEPFATAADYEARYGEVEDPEQVGVLLEDATAFIAAQPGLLLRGEGEDGYELQRANLRRACCSVVHRSLSAGDLAGFSNLSQAAGVYNASVTLANPTEDFYLTAAEKKSLGISGARIGSVRPAIHGRGGDPIW